MPSLVLTLLFACSTSAGPAPGDWLVSGEGFEARTSSRAEGRELVLSNGLVRRAFRLSPDAATVALESLVTRESVVRAVKPEAELVLDGVTVPVGGLVGQPDHAYLTREWLSALTPDARAMHYVGHEVGETAAPFPWSRVRRATQATWPPPGVSLTLRFEVRAPLGAPDELQHLRGVAVDVHYELYDGLPVFAKWLVIRNGTERAVTLDTFKGDVLAVVETESPVEAIAGWQQPNLEVFSDYAFSGMGPRSADRTTAWVPDPEYLTQVNYRRLSPVLLESRPPVGPGVSIEPGGSFTSFRTYELLHDSTDRERRGLARRRVYRALAPWTTESPLMMHVRFADPDSVRAAVDQCVEVGFEMVILTFGSGFNMEKDDPAYLAQWKELADYAHERGIELGGYSLLSSRRIGPETDVIDAETGKPGGAKFGNAPCLGSEWGRDYFRRLYAFFEATGFDLLEHDGSYPGDTCASADHPGHRGYADSQWRQWETIRDFYRWCRGRGVYLNVPDFYVLQGSNKVGMGYRETNWSLPRAQQIIHGRQNIFDGTWDKPPTMGWMFVPLTEYHGGGAAATLEPLSEHLVDYEAHLVNNLALGVQACWRGPRLYDSDETRELVARWVDWFKRHRDILESDLIHVRRADGRDIDCMLHVNPSLKERGLAVVFNPLDEVAERELTLPLYYTGLDREAMIRTGDGEPRAFALDREYRVTVPVTVPARGMQWLVIE